MSMSIVLRSSVYDELSAAADWYDAKRPGLGNDLLREVNTALKVVVARPQSFPSYGKTYAGCCCVDFRMQRTSRSNRSES